MTRTVLVWRSKREDKVAPYTHSLCPMCQSNLKVLRGIEDEASRTRVEYFEIDNRRCPLCGWYYHWAWMAARYENDLDRATYSVLREFDLNSPRLTLAELGSHLKGRFGDIYTLDWRRFEELVDDVFRRHGFRTVLTARTHDDGADILVVENESDKISAIVECKRYAQHRKLHVGLVRTLVGAALDWEVKRAYLVTTSDFTDAASDLATSFRSRGYGVDLVAASEVLRMLGVYNEQLPPLDKLTPELRRDLIIANDGGVDG